jgi:transmembrane sensor
MIEDLQNNDLNAQENFDSLDTRQKILQLAAKYGIPHSVSKEKALLQVKEKIAHSVDGHKLQNMNTEQKILRVSSQFKVPWSISKEAALLLVNLKISKNNVQELPSNSRNIRNHWIAVAASMLLLFGIWKIWIHKPLFNVVAEKGQHTEYKLPDGSLVSINADSKITFRKSTFNKNRNLILEGEAFFDVKKGESFVINTKLADIKVLGTSFNVTARENTFKVSCFTGKILIAYGSKALTITSGESAMLNHNILTKFPDKNITSASSWRVGEFYYENVSLNLIFNELERQFNITFVLPEMEEMYFTGNFNNKNLVEALDIVCIPMGLTYEIGSNSKVYIHKKFQ